ACAASCRAHTGNARTSSTRTGAATAVPGPTNPAAAAAAAQTPRLTPEELRKTATGTRRLPPTGREGFPGRRPGIHKGAGGLQQDFAAEVKLATIETLTRRACSASASPRGRGVIR